MTIKTSRRALGNEGPLTWIASVLLALLAVTFALTIWRYPLYYFFDDALFYLQIAGSVADGNGPQFSTGIVTNGYHPLWMLLCAVIALFTDSKTAQLNATAAFNVALVFAWLLLAWRNFARVERPLFVILGLLLGVGYVAYFGFGMESALALLLYTGCVVALVAHATRPTGRALLVAALLAGLTVVARLDLALLLIPPIGWRFFVHLSRGQPRWAVVPAALAGGLPPVAWLGYNLMTFGAATPISGMLKITGPGSGPGLPPASGVVYLFLSVAVAALVAAALGRDRRPMASVAAASALGHLVFFAYLGVSGNREAYAWYYVPLAGSMAFLLPVALETGFGFASRLAPRLAAPAAAIAALALIGGSTLLFVRDLRRPMGIEHAHFAGPDSLGKAAARAGVRTVLVYDRPGILAYLDGLNVIAADGLTTNLAYQRALRAGGVNWLMKQYKVDAVLVPRIAGGRYGEAACGLLFFASARTLCKREPDGDLVPVAMRYYSRLDGSDLGTIPLANRKRLDYAPRRDFELYLIK